MRISKETYYRDMGKAFLKGYFKGLGEGRKQKEKGCKKRDTGVR